MDEQLILVDEKDKPWGKLDKDQIHQLGLLHRAFSVFIFNSKGELLLQQRAQSKYHSAGLWTNTCCSHPRYGEELKDAVARRLEEEMGLICSTHFIFSFIYKATFENGLTEYELDHIFYGATDELPTLNPVEASDYKYITLIDLEQDLLKSPGRYTVWLKICLPKLKEHFQKSREAQPVSFPII